MIAAGFRCWPLAHQLRTAGDPYVDARPHIKWMGAVEIQQHAITTQAIGDSQYSTFKPVKEEFLHSLELAAAVALSHERRNLPNPQASS